MWFGPRSSNYLYQPVDDTMSYHRAVEFEAIHRRKHDFKHESISPSCSLSVTITVKANLASPYQQALHLLTDLFKIQQQCL